MKKKLLTLLLAVVMVFGVFGLTACGSGTNPDESYNYYSSKYEVEGEVKIEAVTFLGVQRMVTTSGKFVLYIDNESAGAKERFNKINKLANDWNITIHHFNPDLSGGYASDDTSKHTIDLTAALDEVGTASQVKFMQDDLSKMIGKDATTLNQKVIGISGAAATYSVPAGYTIVDEGAGYIIKDAEGNAVYDSSAGRNQLPARGTLAAVKYNGKCTVAELDKGADAIRAVATKKPSYGNYTEDGEIGPDGYNTSEIKAMNLFADGRLHMYSEDGSDAYTEEKTDVYVTVANYGQFAELMSKNDGYFAVFFGGTWCPNTQAIAMLTNDLAKDYGISKIYFFDPRLDDGVRVGGLTRGEDEDGNPIIVVSNNGGNPYGNLNTRSADATGDGYNYNYLYARFLNEYLPTYQSQWNIGSKLSITSNGTAKDYTKMCVPNMMMFNGEGEGKAELVGLAEAEYSYSNTSVEGSAENVEWTNAIKAIFDANPYALYNPIIEAPATDDSAAGGSTGGSTGGGATTAPPADSGC